jgi:hypothetical protein
VKEKYNFFLRDSWAQQAHGFAKPFSHRVVMKISVLQPIGTQCTFFMPDLALWPVIWANTDF